MSVPLPAGPPVALSVDVEKQLGDFRLRSRFTIAEREIIVLFGHSGSGKSLTLRAVAGLLRPDAGCISIGGVTVFDARRRIDRPPQERGIGMVVQSYALFPHLSVRDNIAFGLHGRPRDEVRQRVDALLELLAIGELAERRPEAISGGQAQRVALARALAPRPRLLLLDEPFSALDSAIRVNLRRELLRLKRELGLAVVFVTHDLREAYTLADSIAVMDAGRVLQVGSRDDVFNRPVSARVAQLTEVRNIWSGAVTAVEGDTATVQTDAFPLLVAGTGRRLGERVQVCIRPERVLLLRPERAAADHRRDTVLRTEIVDEFAHGVSFTLLLRVNGSSPLAGFQIEADLPAHPYEVLGVQRQRTWDVALPREALHVMATA